MSALFVAAAREFQVLRAMRSQHAPFDALVRTSGRIYFRHFSFAAAASRTGLPAMRGRALTPTGHALLMPLLLAVCALFVHGLGYVPRRAWAARLMSAWLLWPLAATLGVGWAIFS